MTIGRMPAGMRPTVQAHENEVAVWATAENEPAGFVMTADSAIDTAFAMLAAASALKGGRAIRLDVRSIELLEAVEVNEEMAARLVIDADGAPLAIDISAMNLAVLAAEFAAASRKIG